MALLEAAAVRRRVFVLGVLVVLSTVIATLAAFARPPVDEAWYVALRDLDALGRLSFLEPLRSLPGVLVLAALALTGWRCRALLAAVAVSLATGVLATWLLRVLVARDRPYDSGLTGTDSYPSPYVLLLSVLVLLTPLSLRVLTGRSRATRVTAVGLALAVAGAGLHEVYAGLRWPLDVAGAMTVGAGVAVAARVVLVVPGLHHCCAGCPWQGTGAPDLVPAAALSHRARRGHPLYRAAALWSVGLAGVLAVLSATRGIPRSPESGVMGPGLEVPLNLGLLALIVLGVLLAARWHLAGALLVAFAGSLLGYASSVQYAAWVAAALTTAALAPAVLLWVQWHRVSTVPRALAVAGVSSLLLGTTTYLAASNYADEWGPTHPTSATPAVQDHLVDWMWAGAVTDTSVTVKARTEHDADQVRLVVGRGDGLSGAVRSAAVPSLAVAQNVVSLTVDVLEPGRAYTYALEVDGVVDRARLGRFSTFPRGPSSFTFAVGADARTGSNGMVFDAVRRTHPLLYLNLGDFFYGDVDRNDPELYRRQYDANLAAPAQAALYAGTPIAYTWGDHDFAGNDSDGTAVSRPAAVQVYRQYVPHYPLPPGDGSPIFQAFTVGDVRFVLTDNRSRRDPPTVSPRSMLGARQRSRLLDELARADEYGLLVWGNADPWVGRAEPGNDTWAGFAEERRAIADAIAGYRVDNLLMVSGDAHMVAWDDGTHTDYSASGEDGFPLFHAAALDRKASIKGGPYTGPVIGGGGQFGTVEVRDDGHRVAVTVVARNYRDEVLFERAFTVRRDGGGPVETKPAAASLDPDA